MVGEPLTRTPGGLGSQRNHREGTECRNSSRITPSPQSATSQPSLANPAALPSGTPVASAAEMGGGQPKLQTGGKNSFTKFE